MAKSEQVVKPITPEWLKDCKRTSTKGKPSIDNLDGKAIVKKWTADHFESNGMTAKEIAAAINKELKGLTKFEVSDAHVAQSKLSNGGTKKKVPISKIVEKTLEQKECSLKEIKEKMDEFKIDYFSVWVAKLGSRENVKKWIDEELKKGKTTTVGELF